eukprot:4152648-Prymnesium_polylepis.1
MLSPASTRCATGCCPGQCLAAAVVFKPARQASCPAGVCVRVGACVGAGAWWCVNRRVTGGDSGVQG